MSEVPVPVHCGVSDGQRHHGHAVHVVRYTLRVLHIPVNPTRPRDPLQVKHNTQLIMTEHGYVSLRLYLVFIAVNFIYSGFAPLI